MTYGFEREFFVLGEQGKGRPVMIAADHGFPYDGCGYLAEARGESHADVIKAAYLLEAEERSLFKIAASKGFILTTQGQKLPPKFKHECSRRYGKRVQTDFSLSGRWNSSSISHAGLHIHFGNQLFWHKDGVKHLVGAGMLNLPAIITRLDKRFAKEIKEAKRAPGLYKINDHGFEYRSLPASLAPQDVADFVDTIPRSVLYGS